MASMRMIIRQGVEVVSCFEEVARTAACAVHLWHHTRKMGGDQASVESARGAQAFIDACRSIRILETMSKKTRDELLGVMPEIGEPDITSASSTASATLRRPRINPIGSSM